MFRVTVLNLSVSRLQLYYCFLFIPYDCFLVLNAALCVQLQLNPLLSRSQELNAAHAESTSLKDVFQLLRAGNSA